MTTIIGISGSVRRASFNAALLRVAAAECPPEATIRIESIAGIPLYNGDEEAAHDIPEPVTRLKEAIAAADGLLRVTPEYNNSLPGVAKNAIDWLSRPRLRPSCTSAPPRRPCSSTMAPVTGWSTARTPRT